MLNVLKYLLHDFSWFFIFKTFMKITYVFMSEMICGWKPFLENRHIQFQVWEIHNWLFYLRNSTWWSFKNNPLSRNEIKVINVGTIFIKSTTVQPARPQPVHHGPRNCSPLTLATDCGVNTFHNIAQLRTCFSHVQTNQPILDPHKSQPGLFYLKII